MGRAWCIEYEGGLYHVLSRGNERRDIFRDDRDRLTFLDVIGEMTDQYRVDVFAYTLMTNHYHILLRTNDANLSRSMSEWQLKTDPLWQPKFDPPNVVKYSSMLGRALIRWERREPVRRPEFPIRGERSVP